jgi:DNA-binding LytR/AlgR family response regulator
MQTVYNCIIVDDNELDRLTVQAAVKKYPFLQIVGIYDNAESAFAEIEIKKPSVLFLDIDLPGMNGITLRSAIGTEQACIFITSHLDYALESFEQQALDFLLKPINAERFSHSMQRLQHFLEIQHKATLFDLALGGDTVFIKDGNEQIKIKLGDIVYLEALKDYTTIVTEQKKYHVLSSIGNLLKEKAFETFIRIHRSYAIQKHFIQKISAQQIMVQNITLPIGRSYKESVELLLK